MSSGCPSLVIAGEGKKLGLYGFGAAAHILAQVAKWQGRSVFAFTRPGDIPTQDFATALGATWAGGSDEMPPEPLDAAIIFAPAGALVPLALKAVRKGGRVVCAGIHMSDIPSFPYSLLWEERQLVSVANLTRQDGIDFLRLAPESIVIAAVLAVGNLCYKRRNGSAGEFHARQAFRLVIWLHLSDELGIAALGLDDRRNALRLAMGIPCH